MIVRQRISDLDCVLVGLRKDRVPDLVCILCHGFGAPGDDLVPLGSEYLLRDPALQDRVLCVFPEAPHSLAAHGMPDGRAWWQIDMFKLQRAVQFGELRDLRRDTPVGLNEARELLAATMQQLQSELNLPASRFVLGGFSQGGMLTTDLTLHLADKPAGLIIYSGTLLSEDDWRSHADSCAGLPILQSHGRSDSLLPFTLAEELRDMFQQAGADIEFHAFPGMHTIPNVALQATTRFLTSILESHAPRE
jgi:phospholipase/carboxylesterase